MKRRALLAGLLGAFVPSASRARFIAVKVGDLEMINGRLYRAPAGTEFIEWIPVRFAVVDRLSRALHR